MDDPPHILTINGGSSSIKFALYRLEPALVPLFSGNMEYKGPDKALIRVTNVQTQAPKEIELEGDNHPQIAEKLLDWLEKQPDFAPVVAIGHRVVHGMQHTEPERVTQELIRELKKISALDPDHLPEEIRLIEACAQRHPNLPQIACFDTAFHTSMPKIAKLLPIPRRYFEKGIQRYGFHGLSYAYLLEELERIAGQEVAKGRVILAHLGSGASLAAVKDGKSLDTSMGFTPTAGLVMGTRTGDLDPGVVSYLLEQENLSPKAFNRLINQESGLLGISETSADMRELLHFAGKDPRAAEAIELFCYQTRKWIGAFAAVLEGLDTLVFSGGIGENVPEVRRKIAERLGYLGIELDETKNRDQAAVISTAASRVVVRVIKTDEEFMIATLVGRVLKS
ncbi:MAG: acetate/propionate family kinase [Saprospiraceae bacterium]